MDYVPYKENELNNVEIEGKNVFDLLKVIAHSTSTSLRYADMCQLCKSYHEDLLYIHKMEGLKHIVKFGDLLSAFFSGINVCEECDQNEKIKLELNLLYSYYTNQLYPIEINDKNKPLTQEEKDIQYDIKCDCLSNNDNILHLPIVNVKRSSGAIERWYLYDVQLKIVNSYHFNNEIIFNVGYRDKDANRITLEKNISYGELLKLNPSFRLVVDNQKSKALNDFTAKYKDCFTFKKMTEFREYVAMKEFEEFAKFHITKLLAIQRFVVFHYWNPEGTMRKKILDRQYASYCNWIEEIKN